MSETRTRTRTRRLSAALVATLALVAVACEQNADGSFSVDQAFLCVHPGNGDIRWTASKTCAGDELLIRVDEPDPGPQPQSWRGELAMGATSPAVSSDGAARTFVHLATTREIGPQDYARCELVLAGATTSVLGIPTSIGAPTTATIEWSDPTAANTVAVSCTAAGGWVGPAQVSIELIPTA